MMLGTLAQRGGVVQGRPAWLPEGAIAFLDFVNGNYYADGRPWALGDILANYDAGEISSFGMLLHYESPGRPMAAGPLQSQLSAALAAGCTLVFRVNFLSAPYSYVIGFYDGTRESDSTEYVSVGIGAAVGSGLRFAVGDHDDIQISMPGDDPGAGMYVIAVTLNRDEGGGDHGYALSVNGAAAETGAATYSPVTPASITIGHDGNDQPLDNAYIRSIALYPALPPADLPALSA